MNPQNDYIREFLGVNDAWKDYTGQGVIVATAEDFEHAGINDHAYLTYQCLKEIAPDCEVIYLPMEGSNDATFMSKQIAIMKERKVDIWFASLSTLLSGLDVDPALAQTADFCTWINSIGNADTSGYSRFAEGKLVIGVGAFGINSDGSIQPESFSSETEYVDFCAPDGFIFNHNYFYGTSASAPALTGLLARAICYIKAKTGKGLSSAAAYQLFLDLSHDFYTVGKDNKTGWGYVTLPAPETIDISKYQTVAKKTIYRVQVGAFGGRPNAEKMRASLIFHGYSGAFIKSTDGIYRVQVGAFTVKENAENLLKQIKAQGFSAFVTT